MTEVIDIGNLCTHCHKDTSFGSGRFVNRIPSETETESGYMCPECQPSEDEIDLIEDERNFKQQGVNDD